MKLLLTLDFPPERGGIQRYLFDKVAHTYGPGDAVVVGTVARRASTTVPAAATLPCRVSRYANVLSRINKKWSLLNLVSWLVFKLPPDRDAIIECGNIYAAFAPWLLSLFRPLNYRVYTYGGEVLCLRRKTPMAWVFRRILERADALFVLGNYVALVLHDAGIKNKMLFDPPRIALPEKGLPVKPGVTDTAALQLLSVGRLVPHKGHAVLLEALSLLGSGLDWRLVLAGSGPEEKRLRAIIAENRLSHRVIIKTGLDDLALAAEYRKADLFVLPSVEIADGAEGFGIVLLEAAIHGVPIVASRVGGVPEVLDDGGCGVLVDPGNPVALCTAIDSLSRDAETRNRLTARAFARVQERYAW